MISAGNRDLDSYLKNVVAAADGQLKAYTIDVRPVGRDLDDIVGKNPICIKFPPEISYGKEFSFRNLLIVETAVKTVDPAHIVHQSYGRFKRLLKIRCPGGYGNIVAGICGDGTAEKLETGFSLGFSAQDIVSMFIKYINAVKAATSMYTTFQEDMRLFSDGNVRKLVECLDLNLSLNGFGPAANPGKKTKSTV